nr:unnamed protein product [Callosobruchus analis]
MVLCSLYHRNGFTLADSNFIDISLVPSTSVSLRTASGLAPGSKQGFVQCNCMRYCVDKKCACIVKKTVCNNEFHNNSSCKNKYLGIDFLFRVFMYSVSFKNNVNLEVCTSYLHNQ